MDEVGINLEELAEESTDKEIEATEEKQVDNNKDNKSADIYNRSEQILSMPFEIAMENLKVSKEEVIEAGKQLFETGNFKYEIELPFGNKCVLQSKKVLDEADYFSFLFNAIEKQMNMEEFQYILNIRNLAHSLVSINDEDYTDKTFEEKYEMLMDMPAPFVAAILNASSKFWAILLLMLHKDFVGFLIKQNTQ